MKTPQSIFKETTIRAILSCIVCDLPATRKVCGFLSYNARFDCSKCLKQFPKDDFTDFSGYECEGWPQRNAETHVSKAKAAEEAESALARSKIQSSYGARYSELFELPYYDVIRHHVVDPMHNLFLGIAKHRVSTWRKLEILDKSRI